MLPFTIHWSRVPQANPGLALFALWPSPVREDACFRKAGFTEFGWGNKTWDAQADILLDRLLEALTQYGPPRRLSAEADFGKDGLRQAFSTRVHRHAHGQREQRSFGLRQQIQLPMQWDDLPDCLVGFGDGPVSLRTGSGHHLYWITLPEAEAIWFSKLAAQAAAPHRVLVTDLQWEYLLYSNLNPALLRSAHRLSWFQKLLRLDRRLS